MFITDNHFVVLHDIIIELKESTGIFCYFFPLFAICLLSLLCCLLFFYRMVCIESNYFYFLASLTLTQKCHRISFFYAMKTFSSPPFNSLFSSVFLFGTEYGIFLGSSSFATLWHMWISLINLWMYLFHWISPVNSECQCFLRVCIHTVRLFIEYFYFYRNIKFCLHLWTRVSKH